MTNTTTHSPFVRAARKEDAPALLTLIDALAAYEQLDPPDDSAKRRLIADGFERTPARFDVFLVFEDEGSATPLGYAIVLETYSSFLAQPTLYIEDFFVLPEARGKGAGSALFQHMAAEAVRRDCGRMEWVCLNWNVLAIGFYDRRGAQHMEEWRTYRLTAEQLRAMTNAPTTSGGYDRP